ncbi:neither inactivation nor afterpotential protein G [Manduca sexta]|uniref:neither inactivation nor afterpotential protein G n=1 Tax=Manduca sexta TaxID=7130 RepID=UPI00188FA42F|nr:neither inactivation nor afterpotential protein G [Manduca sexta]
MPVYSYIFGVFLACASYLVYQKYVNVYTSVVLKPEKRYDYIIVGAGTAGCVLAARLSEDPKIKVLLVEAGDQMGFLTKIPLTPTSAQLGPNDWSVRTVPQKFSSFGMWKQTSIIPRGKGLGGSGQINFLLHGFGLPQDYERWPELGFNGWSFDDLRPYFIKAFGTSRSDFDSGHCSVDGECPGEKAPMKLKLINEDDELMNTFKKASEQLKNKYSAFRKATGTVVNGMRHGTLDAYLKPAMARKNLHILLRTQAVSIRFENTTASSLYILQDHRELNNIFVNKEIILCAGVIKSPQILVLSGIGPRDLLQSLRIKVISENSHVGRNYHDHMNMPVYVSVKKPISVTLSKVFTFSTVWDYIFKNDGLLSFPPLAGFEHQNKSLVMLFSMGTASERLLRDLSNYKPLVFRSTFPFYNSTHKEGFIFLSTCTQPLSRGYVTLSSAAINIPPVVDPRYLEQYSDVKCMIQAIRRVEQLISSKAFQEIGARIHWPRPERCLTFWNYTLNDQMDTPPKRKRFSKGQVPKEPKQTKPRKSERPPDAYLECIIREVAVTGHHASGTCSGGTVVDDELRVKSVTGVRIVDASVFPSPLSFYPNSVLVAMAERAADMILSNTA